MSLAIFYFFESSSQVSRETSLSPSYSFTEQSRALSARGKENIIHISSVTLHVCMGMDLSDIPVRDRAVRIMYPLEESKNQHAFLDTLITQGV